ncbi:aspartate--ammonia ligase [Metabacillus malikii]|uniref:Aspartate--ammonia ligase n=1 Tax=Metabacillus malikii TaxID=1504265 RepID=A0ABT9ZF43_9BACI|nr:aspartate--ammonia ligase [Metabacillus malikii]MDQ0230452.1 aspartate--ammonia ligase [Metabacillus malikii]
MSQIVSIPKGYQSKLNLMHTEIAIKELKDFFEDKLAENLNLIKVSAPLLLLEGTGINDNLNGVERIVNFDALDIDEKKVEIVQSLAKWKRSALARYGFTIGEGLYTNMNAIRRDETLDNLHSMFVDQWDWEKVISKGNRTIETLKDEVQKIYLAIKQTEQYMFEFHPLLEPTLPENIHFVTTQELEQTHPHFTPKQREDYVCKEYGAVFLMEIGGTMESGEIHDGRSPDYDDWSLNGDIIVWSPILERSIELSSMGIRVDRDTLIKQLKLSNHEERLSLNYHQSIINNELPFTIGGGIGQSRLCMFLLKKAHIGEVQASVWNEKMYEHCKENNITLL